MSYNISPSAYTDVFVFPRDVVNKHIKLAGAAQLKVLLWLFCNGGSCEDAEQISKDTGIGKSDVHDAMQYWIINGIVNESDPSSEQPSVSAKSELPNDPKKVAVKHTTIRQENKISRFEIARRSSESPEIAWMLTEAQNKFGRTLSNAEMTTLVWLHDNEGLPAEVIVMAVEYAISIGKGNIRYIESTALSWLGEQIDTVEKAENHLIELERRRQEWHKIAVAFGIDRAVPSPREQIYATRWLREWRFSMKMIKLAYNRCVDNTTKLSMSYINKVLDSWHSLGIAKPEDVEKEQADKLSKKKSSNKEKSYDISEVKKMLSGENER